MSAYSHHTFDTASEKLEFRKLLAHISRHALSEGGKKFLLALSPHHNRESILNELQKVTEAKNILITESTIPLVEFKDITLSLKKADIENQALSGSELLSIATVLRISRELRSFLTKRRATFPLLAQVADRLLVEKVVEYNISNALDEQGNVKDSASKELQQIRRKLASSIELLRKNLESIMRKISEQDFLQEEIVTTREGRFVIPVKVEHKHRVPGFIHTTSASGATVYIEPAETLALNNEIRELQIEEQREIYRILLDLTRQITALREELEQTYFLLVEFDSLFARGKYSIEVQGNAPFISEEPTIRLYEARHPILLQHLTRQQVVPLTLELGGEEKTLIITGPNAGGKTVALKLVGLLSLCAQSGIHIPASADSILYPFQKIYVDIGDDQSIDSDLSSFSSHLMYLREILASADSQSLVLIDEIGTGTDPAEGSAIATAVLSELTRRGTITIATTHHGTLKAFASQTHGTVNGSMEFDQHSLRPTYRYRHGLPGSSYAFELAERIGLPSEILTNARQQIGKERAKIEQLLMELEAKAQTYARQLKETEEERKRLEQLTRSYEQKIFQFKKEIATLRKQAVSEAKAIVQDAYAQVEKTIKEIREQQAGRETIRRSKESLRMLSTKLAGLSTSEEQENVSESGEFAKGDIVRLKNGSSVGEIVELVNGTATVVTASARLTLPLSQLQKEKSKKTSATEYKGSTESTIKVALENTSIDIRGLTGEEAIREVEAFLDKAYSAGLHEISIVHGKGTGALRKRIAEYLTAYPHVKAFRLGEWNEGGTGITIVEMK